MKVWGLRIECSLFSRYNKDNNCFYLNLLQEEHISNDFLEFSNTDFKRKLI